MINSDFLNYIKESVKLVGDLSSNKNLGPCSIFVKVLKNYVPIRHATS